MIEKPALRPANPRFSTGPTAKRPGWSPEVLKNALVGRSHRANPAKARLKKAIDETRRLLDIPAEHRVAIVPASDTGAMEMALCKGFTDFDWLGKDPDLEALRLNQEFQLLVRSYRHKSV